MAFDPPAIADVANLIRARTQDDNMQEVGTFNTDTRPTGDEVTALISRAVDAVQVRVGPNLHTDLEPRATELAAIYAAMLVEMSYWPEQIGQDRSPYTELKALFEEGMLSLLESQLNAAPGVRGFASVQTHPDVPSYLIPPLLQ